MNKIRDLKIGKYADDHVLCKKVTRISGWTHRLTGKGTSPPIQALLCRRPDVDIGGSSGGQGGRWRMAEDLASKLAFVMQRVVEHEEIVGQREWVTNRRTQDLATGEEQAACTSRRQGP
ncbi:hypothetical protein E2562_014292 [Oryza meyeriana var. granulata]|uniref:Uncharacterized protein n=1 Tax=Oryza meyeriana var. granulata TaxID=110450 RepID=A0A6G1C7W0_9ORYZ|nr:hypothetical protein E2562_014292 [Oryza meyeriana var. granulata]